MRFTPKSEDQVSSVWPDGEYDFEVGTAEETTSQSGNDMIKLTLNVFNKTGGKRTVFDYLVGTDAAQFKVRGFASAAGLLGEYESGELNAYDMQGRTGKLKLRTDKSAGYPDKNAVASYITSAAPRAGGVAKPKPLAAAPDLNDDIPF